jgi:hypothetical protein
VVAQLEEFVDLSRRCSSDRVRDALVVSGAPGVGKTETIKAFARDWHLARVAELGPRTASGHERWPVCLVTMDSVTEKGWPTAILTFFAWPGLETGLLTRKLESDVITCVRNCETEVVITDDIHFIDPRTVSGQRVNNKLKQYASTLPTAEIMVGVNIPNTRILTEGKTDGAEAQIGRRWTIIDLPSVPQPRAGSDHDPWVLLMQSYERDMVLADHRRGDLSRTLLRYIWDRTQGNVESLGQLTRRGAQAAIIKGEERLTRRLLDGVTIDHTAQTNYAKEMGVAGTRSRK